LLEVGITPENLPLPVRVRGRLPIFLKASWRLFVANPRLMLLYAAWAVFFAVDRWILGDPAAITGPTELPVDWVWPGHAVNGFLSNTFLQVIACAALAAVFILLRVRELRLRSGFAIARRNLFPIILLASVCLAINLLSQLLDALSEAERGRQVTSLALGLGTLGLFNVVAILADSGSGAGAAIAGSWRLFRNTWRDIVLMFIGFWAASSSSMR